MGLVGDARSRLVDPKMIEIYDYWLARRASRRMPSRRSIDPIDLPRHLAEMMLIDVMHAPLRFRYRLIGTSVVAASDENHTGHHFDSVEFFDRNPAVMEEYALVVESGEPLLSLEPFRNFVRDTTYQVERLLLPLSADGECVDMILAYFRFRTGPLA